MNLLSNMSRDGKQLTIQIEGRFDFNCYSKFRDAQKLAQSPDDISYVIDLGHTEYMDSSALGMLLLLRERAGGDSADIRITGCNPDIEKIFAISNFNQLFKIN